MNVHVAITGISFRRRSNFTLSTALLSDVDHRASDGRAQSQGLFEERGLLLAGLAGRRPFRGRNSGFRS
jgi:hypothetical protein